MQNNQTLINIDNKIKKAISKYPKLLGKKGDEDDGKNKIKGVYPMALYGAALYLNARKLKDEKLANFLSDDNKLSGFAEEFFGFNRIRDFLNPLAGGRKKTVKTPAFINKHSGKLIINVKPPIDTEDLVQRIENACVSSFYIGKKGLAYVEDIRI